MSNTITFFLVVLLGCYLCLSEPVPSGNYCGDFLEGILKVNASVITLTEVAIVGSVFGINATCPKEAVLYTESTHVVSFPDIKLTTDCLGNLLRQYGIDPTAVSITYDPVKDTLTIVAEGADLLLTKCASDSFRRPVHKIVSESLAGTYCGVYQTAAKVKVAIVTEGLASTSGSAYGENFTCPDESFKYSPTTSSISLPKINEKSDCLGQIMSKFSIDSSEMSIVYNKVKNQIEVHGPSNNTYMVLTSCPASLESLWNKIPNFTKEITVA
jgi:hypothetical protein